MARGGRKGFEGAALGLAIVAIASGRASAQQPTPPETAWDVGPERAPPPPAGRFPRPLPPILDDGPIPVPLQVDPSRSIGRELGALAEGRTHAEFAAALRDRALDPTLRARLVRAPSSGATLLGSQEDARRRLARLSAATLAELGATWDFEVEAAGLAGAMTEARARELLSNHPGASGAAAAARWLGERCLERGDVEDAVFFFRVAIERGAARAALSERVVALRARPGAALGLPRARGAALGLTWARPGGRRPLAAEVDGASVFVVFADRLVALDRADGRVRWSAVEDAPDGDARVARGHGLVLRVGRADVRAHDPGDGAVVWALTVESLRGPAAEDPADRIVEATPAGDGFALLATLGGVRRLLLVSAAGEVRWSTTLWPARPDEVVQPLRPRSVSAHVTPVSPDRAVLELKEGAAGGPERRATCPAPGAEPGAACGAPLIRGVRCPACGYDAAPEVEAWRLMPDPERAAGGDGRLACVGDRVLLTADGLVGALGLQRGEVLWVLDRGSGLGLGGRRTFVGLSVDAFVAHATTAAGLLVRLDPLDGRLLATLAAPIVEPAPEALALATSPPVIGWRGADGVALATGTLTGDDRPLGPGVVVDGRALVLPVASGLLAVDLVTGERLERVAWPLARSGAAPRLVAGPGDLVVALSAGGVVVVEPGARAPTDLAPLAAEPTDDALLAELDAADWRRRARAWGTLAARETAGAALGKVRQDAAASAEVREVATELLGRLERLERWRRIAPAAPAALLDGLVDGELASAALQALTPHLARGPAVADAVIEVLAKAEGHEVRRALVELAFRAHEPLCGRVVAVIRNAQANLPLSLAAADYLVALAQDGFDTPVKRALVHPDEQTRAMVQVVLWSRAEESLRARLRPDPAYWKAFETSGMHMAMRFQLGQVEPDRVALIDELTRALVPEPTPEPEEQGPRRVPR